MDASCKDVRCGWLAKTDLSSATDLQLRAAHAMSDTNKKARHSFPKVINHKKHIPGAIEPGGYTISIISASFRCKRRG